MKPIYCLFVALICAIFAPLVCASSATAVIGQKVVFSYTSDGTPPLASQWNKAGVAVTGATSATYTITSVVVTDAGVYTVTVSNSAGSVVSDTATLTVNILPPTNAKTSISVALLESKTGLDLWRNQTYPSLLKWGTEPLRVSMRKT